MANVQIKSEELTLFGGIFHVREQFSHYVAPVVDKSPIHFRTVTCSFLDVDIVNVRHPICGIGEADNVVAFL